MDSLPPRAAQCLLGIAYKNIDISLSLLADFTCGVFSASARVKTRVVRPRFRAECL